MKRTFAHEPKTLEEFLKRRAKSVEIYTFTPEGDAIFRPPAVAKLSEKRFPIPPYRLRTSEEMTELAAIKAEHLTALYEEFETANEELHDTYFQYETANAAAAATEDALAAIFAANQRLQTIEKRIAMERNPQRWIERIPHPSKEEIEVKKKQIDRKLEYDVFCIHRSAFSNQDFYVERVAGEPVPPPAAAAAPTEQVLSEVGILGLRWPAEIQVGNTTYTSPFQAVFGETALANGNQDLYEALLGTRSERTIRSLTTPVITELDGSLIETVVRATVEQVPDFKDALLETGDANLLFQSKQDILFAAENLWGKALMNVRTTLREMEGGSTTDVLPSSGDAPHRSVISLDEQRNARTGAIVTQRKIARAATAAAAH